ncbi:ribosome small subunit-dependent GTPase A [Mycoplasmatota bacterium zrk1]
MRGLIIKLIGGLYTVKVENELVECKARGKFRHLNQSPKVGDLVELNDDFIMEIEDRKNDLARPPISNVDQVILVFSATQPKISYSLLDRFIALITYNNINTVLVVTKIDLLSEDELSSLKEELRYYDSVLDIVYTASLNKSGTEDVAKLFKDKISVLAGQSGVGKSTLLNSIAGLDIKTQEISKALGRGKHTTRHIELIEIEGGLVADTAGFSSLDFDDMDEVALSHSFSDFFELSHDCKFRGCLHLNEPKCKVKKLVDEGEIPASRYDNYVYFIEEIRSNKRY